MNLFQRLSRQAKRRALSRSKEYRFFLKHRGLLLTYPLFSKLFNLSDAFTLTRANIIIRGLLNKQIIDEFLIKVGEQSIQEHGRIKHHLIREQFLTTIKLPYFFAVEGTRLYIPFFNRAMNVIYGYEPDKVFDYPYQRLIDDCVTSMIDPFENYAEQIYGSNFTVLIDLSLGDATSRAYYHPDYQTIFIINHQGRLDVKILLFDRGIKKPNLDNIIERIQRCLPFYFANQRDGFVKQLNVEGLISNRLYQSIKPDKTTAFILREDE
jgi:hypothetical protein